MRGDGPDPRLVEELFGEASGLSGEALRSFLASIADPLVRDEIQSLLAAGRRDEGVLDRAIALSALVGEKTIGPYRLLERLGAGGGGEVFRATGSSGGPVVALKVVRLPHRSMMTGLRREVEALARLSHPGIVRLLDSGLDGDLPWYAMELVEGVSLRERYIAVGPPAPGADWWTAQLAGKQDPGKPPGPAPEATSPPSAQSMRERLATIRQLCAPLAYLHGEGFVHRDLKPDNVLIRSSGWPVIVDFGLVSRFPARDSREALDLRHGIHGSAPYISPEQIRGEPVDARCDLYALGCILHEFVTGQAPFVCETVDELLSAHLERQPIRPSCRSSGIPEWLDDLILSLLAKDPWRRPGRAEDVAYFLVRHGVSEESFPGAPPPRSYLYRSRLHGRGDMLQCVVDELASGGHGPLTLVGGESGVGRTRFAIEVARHIRSKFGLILHGTCAAGGSTSARGGALHPFREVIAYLADTCRERGRAGTRAILKGRGKILERYFPELASLPGQEELPSPPELPAEASWLRAFRALARVLGEITPRSKLLLLLDDLHDADAQTIAFLTYLSRSREKVGCRVLGTYRSDVDTRRIDSLIDHARVQGVSLPRLDRDAMRALVGDMLAGEPPEEFFSSMEKAAAGNPFFVSEYLRVAVRTQVLERERSGRWRLADLPESAYERLPLPQSLADLVERSLERLSPSGAAALELLSTMDREVTFSVLSRAAAKSGAALLAGLSELLSRGLIEERGHRYRFAHHQTRVAAYGKLDPDRLVTLHRLVAEAIETLPPTQRGEFLEALGIQWKGASRPRRAMAAFVEAIEFAGKRHSLEEIERLTRSYFSVAQEPSEEGVRLRNNLAAVVFMRQGRLAEAEEWRRLAIEEAGKIEDLIGCANAHLGLSSLHDRRGEVEISCRESHRALALFRQAGSRLGEGRAMMNLAAQENVSRRRQMLRSVLAIANQTGDERLACMALNNLCVLAMHSGDPGEVEELYKEATKRLARAGDSMLAINLGINVSILHKDAGRVLDSLRLQRALLPQAEKLGDTLLKAKISLNLGVTLSEQGHHAEAMELFERGRRGCLEAGDRGSLAIALGNLGDLHQKEERFDEARSLFNEALGIQRSLGDFASQALMLTHLGDLDLEAGDVAGAEQRYAGADGCLGKADEPEFRARLLISRSRLLRVQSRAEEARAIIGQAAGLLEGRNAFERGRCLAEQGLVACACGADPSPSLAEGEELVRNLGALPSSRLGRAVAALRAKTVQARLRPRDPKGISS